MEPPCEMCSGVDGLGCAVTLYDEDLWRKFHEIGTEMIITKSGRRMFPAVRVDVAGLQPDEMYCVLLELVPASRDRFRWSLTGGWSSSGYHEDVVSAVYGHPESPALGSHWMRPGGMSFGRLKLTNNVQPRPGHLVLASMRMYEPRLVVIRCANAGQPPCARTFPLPQTRFVAVTAYQNERVTKLKIDNNPFAKGFRQNGRGRRDTKRDDERDRRRCCGQHDVSNWRGPRKLTDFSIRAITGS